MKQLIIGLMFFIGMVFSANAQLYVSKANGMVKFYSKAPLEDISAVNEKVTSLLKTSDGSWKFKVTIKAFQFEKDLMYQHFLEKKYMWAEEHPYADFSGTIADISKVNFEKVGVYQVVVSGDLIIRGVSKKYTVPGTITVKEDGSLTANAVFKVALADHEVPIPKVVVENIAEVVEVTVAVPMVVYTKE